MPSGLLTSCVSTGRRLFGTLETTGGFEGFELAAYRVDSC
jgi:hypothetical protein